MKQYNTILLPLVAMSVIACQNNEPQAINFGKDQCDHCQMTITDDAYATELITEKGRVYKFDDLSCMESYKEENADKTQNSKLYVSDFEQKKLIPMDKATLISGGELESPMGGNTAAFSDAKKAEEYAKKTGATIGKSEEHHHEHKH